VNKSQFFDASIVFFFFNLVLRATNVTTIKKYKFLKRKLFVSVSSPETMVKTADVLVEGLMAKWNQILDPLYFFPLSLQFYG
jgi:hypothetical protein